MKDLQNRASIDKSDQTDLRKFAREERVIIMARLRRYVPERVDSLLIHICGKSIHDANIVALWVADYCLNVADKRMREQKRKIA